jgi:hypothetical protein
VGIKAFQHSGIVIITALLRFGELSDAMLRFAKQINELIDSLVSISLCSSVLEIAITEITQQGGVNATLFQ